MTKIPHTNNFDLIRLLAATQVLFNHGVEHLHLPNLPTGGQWIVEAFPGVWIFFIVSGFLVSRSFIDNPGSGQILGFAVRRGLRIFPGLWAHYVVILLLLAIFSALPLRNIATVGFWQWIAGAFVLGSDFWGNIYGGVPFVWTGFYKAFPSGVLWTISVELGFYLFVPIVFAPVFQRLKLVWLVAAALAVASGWFNLRLAHELAVRPGYNTTGELFCSPLPLLWVFLIGAMVAYYWEGVKHFFIARAHRWLIVYAIISAIDIQTAGNDTINLFSPDYMSVIKMLMLAGVTISAAFTIPSLGSVLHNRDISYGVYLYHMPIVATLASAGIVGHWWLWPAVLCGTAFIATLSWVCIEHPALRLKNRSGSGLQRRISALHAGFAQWWDEQHAMLR